eukprot:jgi/Picre1/32366/NNA_007712.t1
MPDKKGASGVDNTHRKTWDRVDFHQKAKDRAIREKELEETQLDARKRKRLERDPLHLGLIVERGKLKPREREIDLTSRLNRSHVQSLTSPSTQQGGYHCDICDCTFQDSLAYLDHLNGKYHNRALGMSMEVKRSTADEVRKRLENAKCKKLGQHMGKDEQPKLLEERRKSPEESVELNEPESSQSPPTGREDEDSDVARIMGFGSFG